MDAIALDQSIAEAMRRIALEAALPVNPGETVKAQMRRAYRQLASIAGLPPLKEWRLIAAWKGEAGCWGGAAVLDFTRRGDELRARRARMEETTRAKAKQLAQAYVDAAARLNAIDQARYRDDIVRLEHWSREVGALDDQAGATAPDLSTSAPSDGGAA